MSGVVSALLLSLGVTLVVELLLAALLGVRGMDLVVIGVANCLTNPIVNYCNDWALYLCRGDLLIPSLILLLLEVAAVAGEALLFRALLRYRRIRPLPLSLILNGTSLTVGLLITLVRMVL